jgi:hypothetical protein
MKRMTTRQLMIAMAIIGVDLAVVRYAFLEN